MKASSAKAKGRRAASELKSLVLQAFPDLDEADLVVTPAGVNGPDIHLSPKAMRKFPFAIECKNVERLNIWKALEQAENSSRDEPGLLAPLLAFKRNRSKLKVALDAKVFLDLLRGALC